MSETETRFDIAIIGGGSAAEALLRELEGSGREIVMFETELVGGECPFLACMPSKSMLHDAKIGTDWAQAVERRRTITNGLDDSDHAEEDRDLGATIVRERASIVGEGRVEAADVVYEVDHVVVATGADPVAPPIDGLDLDHERVWTSRDALTAQERPESIVMIGGGVIGSELAFMFAGFGTEATTIDEAERPADDLHPEVGRIIADALENAGVNVINGASVERVELTDADGTVHLSDGSSVTAERVLVAVGRTANVADVGLDTVGVDPDELEVGEAGRVAGTDTVWIAGDAAGLAQYTHVANHHAAVMADHMVGDGTRRYGDVVVPACIFIDPPVMVVGDSYAELSDDDDVVWAEIELDGARNATDEHRTGFLAVAARRSTGCVVAANGIGARFDEIIHALVVAIDGEVPVTRLDQMIQPFPTVGEVLDPAFASLRRQLDDA